MTSTCFDYQSSEKEKLRNSLLNLHEGDVIRYHVINSPFYTYFNVWTVKEGNLRGQKRENLTKEQLSELEKTTRELEEKILGNFHFPTGTNAISIDWLLDNADEIRLAKFEDL